MLRSHSFIAVLALAALSLGICPAASAETASAATTVLAQKSVCTTENAAFTEDDLSGFTSPCAAQPRTLIVETVYFQNASRYGGTALAAYPLVRLRTGLVRNLELVIDPPSQVAESGLRGLGLYPTTRLGYGMNYTLAANTRMASSFGVEMLPPSSRFNIDERQPKYVFDFTFGYKIGRHAVVSAIASGASSHLVGFGRIAPSAAVRFAYDAGHRTQISTDIGARVVARGNVTQGYSDIALNEVLRKNISWAVGLGTTFNPVGNAKAHYLASGFNFHLK